MLHYGRNVAVATHGYDGPECAHPTSPETNPTEYEGNLGSEVPGEFPEKCPLKLSPLTIRLPAKS